MFGDSAASVIMKVGRNLPAIRRALAAAGKLGRAVYVERTRRGRADAEHPSPLRLFVVDFALAPGEARPKDLPKPVVTSNGGSVGGVTVHEFDEVNGWRLTFKLVPGDAGVIELRAGLVFPDKQPSETWVYRWTGD